MIDNFDISCFKPVSYELRLKNVSTLGKGNLPELNQEEIPYRLKPNEYVIGKSVEDLKMPNNLLGILAPTTLAIRIGFQINCGKIDPTYNGPVSFGIQNVSSQTILIEKNMRLVHLMISDFKGEIIPLETKYFGGEL